MSVLNKTVMAWCVAISLASLMLIVSCIQPPEHTIQPPEIQRNWHMAADSNEKILGPTDKNASYFGFLAKVNPGESLILRGEFPHSRYISYVVYDQDFLVADALTDVDIAPLSGVNPFIPGTDRSAKWLGNYEITVLMAPSPEGPRPPNTLYAGTALNGKPNKIMALAYRVYLPDKGYGFRDTHPLAIAGGVPPPDLSLFNGKLEPYRQRESRLKRARARIFWAIYQANKEKLKNPVLFLGEPQSPPIWINNASREDRRKQTEVPNDDTAYIAAPVSNEFGELLVLRWYAARTPEQTYLGKPFTSNVDMRYWSISFGYTDSAEKYVTVLSEKTFADIDVPTLPDGSRQLVIGFGGIKRPESIPQEQWFGVEHNEGSLIMRNIVINPEYPGDFGKLPRGPIALEYDRYTPGGVYCSVAEFANNPDIALSRAELLSNK